MTFESFKPWSYEVLCSDDAMEAFYELCGSRDLTHEITVKLDKLKVNSDIGVCLEALIAGALVAYAETDVNAYQLLDLDLDKPKDKKEFDKKYEPLLDQVYHTDLSHLKKKAVRALKMMHNTELGAWWYEEDTFLEWAENIEYMVQCLTQK